MAEDKLVDLESKVKVEKDMIMRSTPTPYLKIPSQVKEVRDEQVSDWPKPNVFMESNENTLIVYYEFKFEEENMEE